MKIPLKGALMGALITTAGAAAVVGHTIYGVEPSAQAAAATESTWWGVKIPSGLRCNEAGAR